MILTGSEIEKEVKSRKITISPFCASQVNPNSYNFRLGNKIKVFKKLEGDQQIFEEFTIPQHGYVIESGTMYLANTLEIIGSTKYAMSLIGRSSMGRLGLFLQISANLGHVTSEHRWTLELMAAKKIRLYPGMIIGQVSFWENVGEALPYGGVYGNTSKIQESKVYDIDR